MDGRHPNMPRMDGLGVAFPSSGALNEGGAATDEKGGSYTPLRRSLSLSAIGQGATP